MLHAKVFLSDATYRAQRLDQDLLESTTYPVVVQFAGDEPQALLDAALLVQDRATAVDLNLGCPQPIARKGHYGSFLLRDTDSILRILRNWKDNLSIPFTCKIRIVDEGSKDPQERGLQATLRLVDQIEAAGAAAITVHGRNRVMTGRKTGPADWTSIAAIQQRVSIPVIANGGIEFFADVAACAAATGAKGIMSAEALLENPAFFHGPARLSPFRLTREYLDLARAFPSWNFHRVEKAHVARLLHTVLRHLARQSASTADALLANCSSVDDLDQAVCTIENAWAALPDGQECCGLQRDSWYRRHRAVETNPTADRGARKEVQKMWLAGGLRLTR
ncbi:hypothetical protein DYB32_006184 [Aphanomyces invadans]|nr:hypothetical protein DYB32_006184 [Aphanomyces invadans]